MKKFLVLLALLAMSTSQVSAASLVTVTGKDGSNPSTTTNPLDSQVDVGNATVSSTNPLPVQASLGNAAVGTTNSLPVQLTNNTAVLNGIAVTKANCIPVTLGNGNPLTYSTTTAFQTPVATPTDIVGIIGSATTTVRVQKIILSSAQTTAGINKWFLIKRSVADTGSTIVNPTIVPLDSTNAAATAVVNQYTVSNPTTGTAVGTVLTSYAPSTLPASTGASGDAVIFDAKLSGQPIVLRGVAQELDLNFAGAAVPTGLTMSVSIQFTEE